ncbi:MAG TPA: phage holin family protein [Pseudonocardiaceae bacterium]|nr:phage holin family protein [Pseudonocardiaceae bacterium]
MTSVTSAQHSTGSGSGNGQSPVTSIPLTEDDPTRSANGQSLGALVRDATTHLSTLIRAEVELARSEITAEVKQGVRGSLFFIIAITLAVLLMPFLLTTIALIIAIWLPMSAGFGIVTFAMLLVAIVAALLGWRRVRRIKGPRQTISSVRDTAAALKRHGESDQPQH